MTAAELMLTDLHIELFHLRIHSKIDRRTVACSVTAEREDGGVRVSGFSMFPQTDAFIRETAEKTFGPGPIRYDLSVLSRDFPLEFREVTAPVAPFYKDPVIKKDDLLTEAVYGAVLRTFFETDGFVYAQHPDGYIGYVLAETLSPATRERYLRWKNGDYAILRDTVAAGESLTIPPTARLILHENDEIELASGERIRLPREKYTPVRRDASRYVEALDSHAACYSSTPYLWGGKTQVGIDCSGFIQSLMMQEGVYLPRDASMQAYVGEIVGYLPDYEDLLPGDIVFFMNNTAHVFHVGVYIGNRMYLHSSGSQNIIRSSFEPGGLNYSDRYGETFVFARRVRA